MICKYCGRLVTTKNKCLCCGTSQKGSSAVKLTPQQKAEYEERLKQREEEALKLEQERIENEKVRQQKQKNLVAKVLSFVGLGFTALTAILIIIKSIYVKGISISKYKNIVEGSYNFEKVIFITCIIAGFAFLATAIAKRKAGKKILAWILLIAVLPASFILNISIRWDYYGEINAVSGLKKEYVVGETIDYSTLKLKVDWRDHTDEIIKEEEIDLSKYTIKHVNSWPDNEETGVIYIKDDGTEHTSTYSTIDFKIILYIEDTGYEYSISGFWDYDVVNA